ncbi:hypothetical protein SRHO_G00180080 [Serrasalmus rhombeus]
MCWSSPTREGENSFTAVFSSFGLISTSFETLTPGLLRDKDLRHFSRGEERSRAGSAGSRCLLSENARSGAVRVGPVKTCELDFLLCPRQVYPEDLCCACFGALEVVPVPHWSDSALFHQHIVSYPSPRGGCEL